MEAPVSKRNVTRAPFTLAATENSPLNPAVYDHFAALSDHGFGRHQLRGDPAKEVGRFEAVGVDPGQRDQQRRPDGDRTRCAGDVGRPRAAEKIDQHRQKRRRGDEGAVVESEDLGLGRRQDEEGRRRGDDREREKEAHHRVPPTLPPRRARERISLSRSPRPAITAARSVSAIVGHAAISARVRPHPMHSAETGSTTQMRTQGVDSGTGGMAII